MVVIVRSVEAFSNRFAHLEHWCLDILETSFFCSQAVGSYNLVLLASFWKQKLILSNWSGSCLPVYAIWSGSRKTSEINKRETALNLLFKSEDIEISSTSCVRTQHIRFPEERGFHAKSMKT